MTKDPDAIKADSNAKAAARMRKWRAANPRSPEQKAKAREKSQKWRQANEERYNAYLKAWRDANRELLKAKEHARRQKARAAKKGASEQGDSVG